MFSLTIPVYRNESSIPHLIPLLNSLGLGLLGEYMWRTFEHKVPAAVCCGAETRVQPRETARMAGHPLHDRPLVDSGTPTANEGVGYFTHPRAIIWISHTRSCAAPRVSARAVR